MSAPTCPYCSELAEPVTGAKIYPGRKDLARLNYWLCEPCDAYVGCHKPNRQMGFVGWEPLGRLADRALRATKQRAHAAFDPIWKEGHMSRRKAYRWLGHCLDLGPHECHIGLFDVCTCERVMNLANSYLATREFT